MSGLAHAQTSGQPGVVTSGAAGVIVNGKPANELKCDNRKLVTNYLRVGYELDGSWRTFGLRKDFYPAAKVQQEDDISASVLVPARAIEAKASEEQPSQKIIANCEQRLFQRPDDARIYPAGTPVVYDRKREDIPPAM